jgi:hypothetical protein
MLLMGQTYNDQQRENRWISLNEASDIQLIKLFKELNE